MSGKSLVMVLFALTPLAGQGTEVATLGSALMQHTDVARQALAHRDTSAAQDHVAQALAAADKIKAALPGTEEPLRVPVASAFDGVSTMVPAKRRGSADRLKRNSSVAEVNGTYTATMLNVSSARNHLVAAQSALSKGDTAAAETNLAAIQGDVVTNSVYGDLPLVQVRDNLLIVQERVRGGKYKDSVLPLNSAGRALDRFAHGSPAPRHAELASKMALEMNAYSERIEKDHDDAADRVAGWLSHVTGWINSGMAQ